MALVGKTLLHTLKGYKHDLPFIPTGFDDETL